MQAAADRLVRMDAVRFVEAVAQLPVRGVARIFARMIAQWDAKVNALMVVQALAEEPAEMLVEEVAMVQLEFFKWKE